MKKLRAIIADDEADAIEVLTNLLIDSQKVEVVGKISDPIKIESYINKQKPDVLFLDIQMRSIDGLKILKNIREYNQNLPVVFVTAYDKYINEAIKLNVFSYLIKPIAQDELYGLVDKLICIKEQRLVVGTDKIKLPVKDGYVYLHSDDLFLLEAEGNYTRIKTIDGDEYMSSYNLGKLHTQLNNNKFFRISRGCILNSKYIHMVSRKKSMCIARINEKEFKFEISQAFISRLNHSIH